MSTNETVKSSTVVVFPATRRNVLFYNSRIQSEDNYRRSIQATAPRLGNVTNVNPGTFIYKGETTGSGSNMKLLNNRIEFFLEGYYVRLQGSTETDCEAVAAINEQLGKEGGTLWLFMRQTPVASFPDDQPDWYQRFMELNCGDEARGANDVYDFTGLGWGQEAEPGWMNIPLVVPENVDSGPGKLNPTLDPWWFYKPWFLSSAKWAASQYSDKNKIWVDDIYNVPHVCIKSGGELKWLPLGAVYKSSNPSS